MKHSVGFQEPHGLSYLPFDMKRFVFALQSDKKLPGIWHVSSDLPSQLFAFRPGYAFY